MCNLVYISYITVQSHFTESQNGEVIQSFKEYKRSNVNNAVKLVLWKILKIRINKEDNIQVKEEI